MQAHIRNGTPTTKKCHSAKGEFVPAGHLPTWEEEAGWEGWGSEAAGWEAVAREKAAVMGGAGG